jgi:hypothetical protein
MTMSILNNKNGKSAETGKNIQNKPCKYIIATKYDYYLNKDCILSWSNKLRYHFL